MIRDHNQPPLLEPPSTWRPYVGPLPRLQGLVVAVDTETRDDGLAQDRGPGWHMSAGWLAGVSVAWEDQRIYLPIRHPSTECWDQREVIVWLDEIMRHNTIIFHNMGYDMGWLRQAGLSVWPERAHDTYIQAVMVDENWDDYGLDACCARAGVRGKDESALRNAAAAYGVDPKSGLWRLPARHVGTYAEEDARATLDLHMAQWPAIVEDRMEDAYRTEIDLVPVLYDMRRRGIRVNMEAAEVFQQEMRDRRAANLAELTRTAGRRITMEDVNSGERLGPVLDKLDIPYERTPSTRKPKIDKAFLLKLQHPIGALIRQTRQYNDMAEKFVGTYIMEFAHVGRIHADVHQLRDSDGGTRSHRLSYSNPPMQQAPARDDELGPMFRSMFEPESGEYWAAPDFASQEPRMTVHYASLTRQRGSEDMVRYFCDDEGADLHAWNAKLIGWPRKKAKDVYQAMAYGAQPPKLASMLGVTLDEARPILKQFNQRLPWIEGISGYSARMAQERGWIRLIDGARGHFPLWEPANRRQLEREGRLVDRSAPQRLERAEKIWPDMKLERAFTYRAMNRLMQGSGARQTKRAMVACHKEGIPLLLQLHDELGLSVPDERTGVRASELMRDAVKLVVPVRVDLEFGRTFGHAKNTWENRNK